MQPTIILLTIIASVLSLLLNSYSHHDLLSSLLNSLTLGLSIYLSRIYLNPTKSLFNVFFITSLGLIPLFYYSPGNQLISLLPLFSLGFFYLYKHFPKKYVIILWGLFLFFSNLYVSEIIRYPFNIQSSQLIFNSPEINYNMHRHQQDALFIPYKARLLVYSELVYVYAFLTNLFDLLNLKNLSNILLIANVYPFFVGLYKLFRQENILRNICITTFVITALTIGIDRSADRFRSLYLLEPIFIYLILLGIQTINKKLYIALWILSLFLSLS